MIYKIPKYTSHGHSTQDESEIHELSWPYILDGAPKSYLLSKIIGFWCTINISVRLVIEFPNAG